MERPLSAVPRPVWLGALLLLSLQIWHSATLPPTLHRAEDLPPPPPATTLPLLSFGDRVAAGRIGLLWLTSFDAQSGVLLQWQTMDYQRLLGWMDALLALDPHAKAPLLAVAKVYGAVPDPTRRRQAYDWVYRQFLADPNRRWMWLAHVVVECRHGLHDLPLARRYAQALRQYAVGPEVPGWVRQMEIFLLDDMNELEAAKILLGGLVESGQIKDERELAFLLQRLQSIEQRLAGPRLSPRRQP